jgi:hypothetical protein
MNIRGLTRRMIGKGAMPKTAAWTTPAVPPKAQAVTASRIRHAAPSSQV